MKESIQDFLGFRRKIKVRVYGIGYLGNAFHYKDIEIFNSMKFVKKHSLNKIALHSLDKRFINFPRMYAKLINTKGVEDE